MCDEALRELAGHAWGRSADDEIVSAAVTVLRAAGDGKLITKAEVREALIRFDLSEPLCVLIADRLNLDPFDGETPS